MTRADLEALVARGLADELDEHTFRMRRESAPLYGSRGEIRSPGGPVTIRLRPDLPSLPTR